MQIKKMHHLYFNFFRKFNIKSFIAIFMKVQRLFINAAVKYYKLMIIFENAL